MTITRNILLTTALVAALLFAGVLMVNAGHNADGLAGYWPMDDGADPTADLSTHSNDGNVMGAAAFTGAGIAPVPGNSMALTFDGDDDFVEVAHDDELDMTGAYSLSVWVDIDSVPANEYRPIAFRGATDANDIEVYVQAVSGDLIVAHNRGNGGTIDFVGFEDPPVGSLFHLVVTFDGSDVVAYYDGVAAGVTNNTTAMGAPDDTDKGWWFGKVDHSAFGTLAGGDDVNLFEGLLDEIRIYSKALSADEIAALADYNEFELTLEPVEAMNEVGTDHTVTATLDPTLSHIPVLFEVTGANTDGGTVLSDDSGEAEFTYTGNSAGGDDIVACIDTDGDDSCEGEDTATEATKSWFARYFVTGGGNIKADNGKKNAWSFGGNVGIDSLGNGMGQLQITDHENKDSCHFDTFTDIVFSGDETESPMVDVDTITFTAEGECKKEGSTTIEVTMTDKAEPGADEDWIEVTPTVGVLTIPGQTIDGGNIQMHPPGAFVGADADAYVAPDPADCDLTVDDSGGADHTTIQGAIDAASAGDLICVEDGEYDEFTVDKGVTIAGLTSPFDGSAMVTPSGTGVTDLALVESSDVTITGLLFDGTGVAFDGNQLAGVRVSPDGADVDNVEISFNMIKNLATIDDGASSKGIQWFTESGSGFSLTNSSFTHNVISGMDSDTAGGYGIQTVGDMDDVTIGNNTISDVDGAWGAGVALDSKDEVDTSGVSVTANHIMDGIWFDVSVQVEHKVDQTGIAVNMNNIEGLLHGTAVPASGDDVNAENNWWGDNNPSDDVFGPVDFTPWASEAFELN